MRAGLSLAESLAADIVAVFVFHDQGRLHRAAQKLATVYEKLFPDLGGPRALAAAQSYTAALAIKDAIDEQEDRAQRLVDPRWGQVHERFLETARELGLDPRWAYHHGEGYRKHKGEVEYWSDLIKAEEYFCARAARNPAWQLKQSDGRNGPGPLPFLYLVAAECHDLHSEEAARLAQAAMALYFAALLGESGAE
jgi:hypothetical protein